MIGKQKLIPLSSFVIYFISFIVIFCSLIALSKWALNSWFQGQFIDWRSIKANTAIGFLCYGISLLLLERGKSTYHSLAYLLCCIPFFLGIATLLQYLLQVDFGIDQLFFKDSSDTLSNFPGRMTPVSALNFILISLVFFLIKFQKSYATTQVLIYFILFNSFYILLVYIYSDYSLIQTITKENLVTVRTTLLFFLLSIGMLFLRPNERISLFTSRPLSGELIWNRIIPGFLLIVLILGFIKIIGEKFGLNDPRLGLTIVILCVILLLLGLIFANALLLHNEMAKSRQLAKIVDYSGDAIISTNSDGYIVSWNQGAKELYDYVPNEILGQSFGILFPKHRQQEWNEIKDKIGQSQIIVPFETEHLQKSGRTITIFTSVSPIRDPFGKLLGITFIIKNVTELKLAEKRFQKIMEASSDAVVIVNNDGKILFINEQMEKLFGYSKKELLNQTIEILIPEPYRSHHPMHRNHFFKNPKARPMGMGLELYGQRKNDETFPVEISLSPLEVQEGMVTLASIRDISDRKKAQEEILFLSRHDTLTHLHNRAAFNEALTRMVSDAKEKQSIFALLLIDLDNFKNINEAFGFQIGDQLLITIAKDLKKSVRKHDFVGRLDSDEFAILTTDFKDKAGIDGLAKNLINHFNKPFKIEDHHFLATVSIGIALFPDDAQDEITLLKNATLALNIIKKVSRNDYKFYSEELHLLIKLRSRIKKDLSSALQQNQFYIVYQPQYSLPDKKLLGMEVLIRWQHPELGLVSPNEFIPIAEKNGFIAQIGEWVLKTACAQYVAWKKQQLIPAKLKLAVNLSPLQLSNEHFLNSFMQILREVNMPLENLELELTETAVMTSTIDIDPILKQLRHAGVNIAIDDFGTGYSSLNRLKDLHVTSLKIDKTFIDDLDKNPNDAMIVKSIIALGNSLGLKVIPEGVETEKQLQMLINFGCHIVQGFYFGKEALNTDQMTKLLKDLNN